MLADDSEPVDTHEKTLEELLESMTPLGEDEKIESEPISEFIPEPESEPISVPNDDADATLELLATEFAASEDKIVAPAKTETRGKIGKLKNIPVENRIRLGEGITIGSYMHDHQEIKNWMIEGSQMDLVRSRNTSNGAKQIRMVSRVALHATNTKGNLGQRIVNIVGKAKQADGKLPGNGLLVMVVCSLAGGTGAGTVLQVPMYLEEAIRNSYSNDDLEFELACIMPNAFSTTLSCM